MTNKKEGLGTAIPSPLDDSNRLHDRKVIISMNNQFLLPIYLIVILSVALLGGHLISEARSTSESSPNPRSEVPVAGERVPVPYDPTIGE